MNDRHDDARELMALRREWERPGLGHRDFLCCWCCWRASGAARPSGGPKSTLKAIGRRGGRVTLASTSYPGINGNRYNNPRVDALLTQGASELDQGRRKQIYVEMQNILLEDLGAHTLFFPQTPSAFNKRVRNSFLNATNTSWNAHTWWVRDSH